VAEIHDKFAFQKSPKQHGQGNLEVCVAETLPACDPFSDFFTVLIVLKLKFAPIVCVEFCIR
jgi:hypothetical protein